MLSLLEYQVLNACADDYEPFYYPFATANYGGQVFRRGGVVSIGPGEILDAIQNLLEAGFLEAWRLPGEGAGDRERIHALSYSDREVYGGYDCVTFEDHIEKLDYGPHEFRATAEGRVEIALPQYDQYDIELGWR